MKTVRPKILSGRYVDHVGDLAFLWLGLVIEQVGGEAHDGQQGEEHHEDFSRDGGKSQIAHGGRVNTHRGAVDLAARAWFGQLALNFSC